MKAAIYLRVSTDKQDLENQRRSLMDFCDRKDWSIVREYKDVASGFKPGRNQFNRMMADGRSGSFEVLVFWAWDRVTRRGPQAAFQIMNQLQNNSVAWESIQEPFLSSGSDPMTRELLMYVLGWVSKMERLRISERTKAAIARRRALGQTWGRPPGAKDKKPRRRRRG